MSNKKQYQNKSVLISKINFLPGVIIQDGGTKIISSNENRWNPFELTFLGKGREL